MQTFHVLLYQAKGELSATKAARKISPLLSPRTVQDWLAARRTPSPWLQEVVLRLLGERK